MVRPARIKREIALKMDIDAVMTSYSRWAPVYDRTFGAVTHAGRRQITWQVNQRTGSVLEVGVGTGMSLEHYQPHLSVTGIDYSPDMLDRARDRVARLNLRHVAELRQMDARDLDFPDCSFDTVVALHVLSVVPDPERVMAEIARVLKPGGKLFIVNHFKRKSGALAFLERAVAPLANLIGWHSDFEVETVLREPTLKVESKSVLPPAGMMTSMVFAKS